MISLSPSISAVSTIILGPINSQKSSKSIRPPTEHTHTPCEHTRPYTHTHTRAFRLKLTPHLDLLDDLQQLHLCGHVSHRPHALGQILVVQIAVLIVVELLKRLGQLWKTRTRVTLVCCLVLRCDVLILTIQLRLRQLSLLTEHRHRRITSHIENYACVTVTDSLLFCGDLYDTHL